MVDCIALASSEKKGLDIVRITVGEFTVLADYFVLITGLSRTQVRAIAAGILDELELYDRKPLRIEGLGDASWILLDYADVIVHVFLAEERRFYSLEAFWGRAPRHRYLQDSWQEHTLGESSLSSEEELAEL